MEFKRVKYIIPFIPLIVRTLGTELEYYYNVTGVIKREICGRDGELTPIFVFDDFSFSVRAAGPNTINQWRYIP